MATLSPHTPDNRNLFIPLPFLFILLFLTLLPLSVKSEEEGGGISIKSKTNKVSAQLMIDAELAGLKSPDPQKAEKDKTRTTIGVGEVVTLMLDSKIGDPDKVTWKIEKGEKGGGINPQKGKEVTFTATIGLKSTETTTIKAETEDGRSASITFTIIPPQKKLSAKHELRRINPVERGVPSFTKDGQTSPGASARLEVTVLPTDVNFEALQIIEKDIGHSIGAPPDVHTPGFTQLKPGNRFYDKIGKSLSKLTEKEMLNELEIYREKGEYPVKQQYLCQFSTQAGHILEQIILQEITMDIATIEATNTKKSRITVSKFGLYVTRITGGNHEFGLFPKKENGEKR